VVGIEWLEPIMVAGNWMPEMIQLAGGAVVLAEAGKHSPYITWEQVRDSEPEVMLIMPCGFDLPRTMSELDVLTKLPGWAEMPAAKAERVFAVDGNAYFNRSGPRMVDSLEILASFVQQREMLEHIPSDVWQQIPTKS
jgi:iron complex transport system substrate-binding protein